MRPNLATSQLWPSEHNGSHQQQVETSRTPAGATEPAIQTAEVSDNEKELMELQVAVSNLHSKLEMLQPIGMRPSDLATAAERSTVRADDILVGDSENSDEKEEAGDHEEVLSQVPTSQCSVLLWDELQVLVATSSSSVIKLRELVDSAVSELGLEHLEDGVLNRLCSEIFEDTQGAQNTEIAKDIEDGLVTNAKTLQLSYPGSLFLFRVLFYQKALHIKSKPSRLFLHSIVHAGRNHGRAIVDAILLPLFRDYERYSKVSSELVQNVLKEQTSAGMIHFLSMVLDSVVGPDTSGSSHDSSLSKFPVLFMTETHLDTMKSVLGYANVPSPLPSRLWIRFNNVLEMLWDQLAVMVSSTSLSSSCHSILKLYSSSGDLKGPSSTSDQNQRLRDSGQDPLRLSNLNLVQLVMTWTMRQGPMCQDVDSLQRLRQFCAMRMDVKQCKNLVAKLDMFIKRKTKKQ
ncbi:hypothetical protein BGX28_001936 [Mortierella sp. GBA30]|nr:hypothetical protein BGX28_001936 [Mortierella sp. GBA30]